MSQALTTHGVMEGEGAYNQHAKLPARGATRAIPFLEQAVDRIALDFENAPLVVADYGSSQGKNSLIPIGIAVKGLRNKVGPERPIFVFHVDQPTNDFTSLFEVVERDPNTYALEDPNVFPCVIGRSFYKRVLPCDSVHVGWSSYAAVWLSRTPMTIPDHFVALRSGDESVRAAFARQAGQDWEQFLRLRASELRRGGRMVIVLPGVNDDGVSGFENLLDYANAALSEMADEGHITAQERARMLVASYPRQKSDLLAPFEAAGHFAGLVVEACEISELKDAAWDEYQRTGDKESLASTHALFLRSIFMPSLASVLNDAGDERRRAFAWQLESGLTRRLMERPSPVHSLVATMVVAKLSS